MTRDEAIKAFEIASMEHALSLAKARAAPSLEGVGAVSQTADAFLAAALTFAEFLPKEGNGG